MESPAVWHKLFSSHQPLLKVSGSLFEYLILKYIEIQF